MACVEAVQNRYGIVTRYPIDSRFNSHFTEIEVSSTKDTEPMLVNGTFYKYYPKITAEDINSYSGTRFVDTLQMSNLYLPGIGGD
jgi:hypothetical protein